MRKTHALLAATTAVAAIATTAPAFAAGHVHPIKAVTHTSDHPDTTSVPNDCPQPAQFDPSLGPVWATDNLSLQLVATPDPNVADTYSVKVTAHGTFDAFADPSTGACWTGHGSMNGWIIFTVTSSTAPDKHNLPAQEPGDMSQGSIVAQFFGVDRSAVTGGDSYHYVYNKVNGSRYVQNGA